jgi:hypothetical protein
MGKTQTKPAAWPAEDALFTLAEYFGDLRLEEREHTVENLAAWFWSQCRRALREPGKATLPAETVLRVAAEYLLDLAVDGRSYSAENLKTWLFDQCLAALPDEIDADHKASSPARLT